MHVTIEKIVTGGYGLARAEGQVLLIPGTLPAEQVEIEIQPDKGESRARLVRVLEPSPDRVPAEGLPPTLDLAHAAYEAQLVYKREFVRESLERIGKLSGEVLPVQPSRDRWFYRGVVQYALEGGRPGYRGRESHDFMPLERAPGQRDLDPAAVEVINAGLEHLEPRHLSGARELVLRSSLLTGETLVALIGEGRREDYNRAAHHLAELGVAGVSFAPLDRRRFGKGAQLLWGESTVLERYGTLDLSVSATGFSQINPPAASALYLEAVRHAGVGGHALDLYGGAGALGLHLASGFERVTVLDSSREALERGDRDAERLGITGVRFYEAEALDLPRAVDVIVVDPPRAGLDKRVVAGIEASKAQKLIYISCDPSTWGRDMGRFVRGGWKLTHIQPWDFYPQTAHVEVLSVLER